jgi:heptosyltransferase-3
MSLARERLVAVRDALLRLPRSIWQLGLRALHPDPALGAWCEERLAAGQLPVVLCRIERLGDIVATTAVAGHLRRTLGPNARIAWVCAAPYLPLLRGDPAIDEVFVEPCLTSWMLQRRRLPPQTLAVELFLDSDRCCWTGLRVKQHESGWTIHNYYRHGTSLLAAYSGAAGYPMPDLPPSLPSFARMRETRSRGPGAGGPRVAVHFASRDAARRWPAASARRFCENALAAGCILVELGDDAILASQIDSVENLPHESDISDHLHALAACDCFVGVDSGFAHCANALEIPSVILLGEFRDFRDYCPFSGPHARGPLWRILRSGGPLELLSSDAVSEALAELLKATPLAPVEAVARQPQTSGS